MLTLPDFKQKQIVFAFLSYGEKIRFSNDNLIILDEEGNEQYITKTETVTSTQEAQLYSVFIASNSSLNEASSKIQEIMNERPAETPAGE